MLREEALERIKKAYGYDYDIDKAEMESRTPTELPVYMTAAYHAHNAKYVLSRKAVLWEAGCHEYLYIYDVPELTEEMAKQCIEYAYEEGMKLVKSCNEKIEKIEKQILVLGGESMEDTNSGQYV